MLGTQTNGWQDGRHRQIHCAMAAPPHIPFFAFIQTSDVRICLFRSLSLSLKHFFRILSTLPPPSHSLQSVFSLSQCHLVSHPRYLHLPRQNLIYLYLFSISLQSVFFSFSMSFSVVSFSTYIYLVEALYTTYLPISLISIFHKLKT